MAESGAGHPTVAVLGDMLELGPYERQGHELVGMRAAQVAKTLITLGTRGHMIADAVAIIGTMDIVFGEIDR